LFYQCLKGKGYTLPGEPVGNPVTAAVEAADNEEILDCWTWLPQASELLPRAARLGSQIELV